VLVVGWALLLLLLLLEVVLLLLELPCMCSWQDGFFVLAPSQRAHVHQCLSCHAMVVGGSLAGLVMWPVPGIVHALQLAGHAQLGAFADPYK
jgi:hypothetical protein